MAERPMIVVLGPTASGKTALAVNLARALDGEIISADSRQVYQRMDIGTGKDRTIYTEGGTSVSAHLLDILPAGDKYNVHRFKEDFRKAYSDIVQRHHQVILCGGSGLYIEQVLKPNPYTVVPVDQQLRDVLSGLEKEQLVELLAKEPAFSMRVDLTSKKRIIRAIEISRYLRYGGKIAVDNFKIPPITVLGLAIERPVLRSRILERLDERLEMGMVEEVSALLSSGVDQDMLHYYGLEYKFLARYLAGELSFDEMREKLFTAIAQYAKRQVTFFKKMEKDGLKISWIDASMSKERVFEESLRVILNGSHSA